MNRSPLAFGFRAAVALSVLASVAVGAASCGDSAPGDAGGGGGTGGGSGDGGTGGGGGDACSLPGTGATACAAVTLPELTTELFVGGFDRPLFAAPLPGTDDIVVVEQRGTIQRIHEGAIAETEFLDIEDRVDYDDNEAGLYSIAFHPDYLENGRFFVAYNGEPGQQNVVAEYRVSDSDPLVADDTEIDRLMEIDDPELNHNGGMMQFGADGYLYVALGDSGSDSSCESPSGCAQDTSEIFGSILRYDVDAAGSDYVAPCAPFPAPGGDPHIWYHGLRNPWRFSFDRLTGDMYVADVGETDVEEVSFVPAGSPGGLDFGWRAYEGFEVENPDLVSYVTDHFEPVVVQRHTGQAGASTQPVRNSQCVVGGYVYRGDAIPALRGFYLFGDCQSNDIAAFRMCDGEVSDFQRVLAGEHAYLASFFEDADGELYILASDQIRRIIVKP